jgi:hypothetical protein
MRKTGLGLVLTTAAPSRPRPKTGHLPACLAGHAGNLIEPASALPALELALDVHQRQTQGTVTPPGTVAARLARS